MSKSKEEVVRPSLNRRWYDKVQRGGGLTKSKEAMV